MRWSSREFRCVQKHRLLRYARHGDEQLGTFGPELQVLAGIKAISRPQSIDGGFDGSGGVLEIFGFKTESCSPGQGLGTQTSSKTDNHLGIGVVKAVDPENLGGIQQSPLDGSKKTLQ